MARCRLQHSEGAPRRTPHSGHIGVCDIREAAGRERVASTAGNRPLFYFRFGERTFLRERDLMAGKHLKWPSSDAIVNRSAGLSFGGTLRDPMSDPTFYR